MAIPATITLVTATPEGNQDAAGWSVASGLYEVIIAGQTWGGATVALEAYDSTNAAWIATGDTWTADAVPKIEFAGNVPHRYTLSVTGTSADIDILTHLIRRYSLN